MEISKLIFEIDAISGQVIFYVIKMIYQIWNFFGATDKPCGEG
jgi:hypothetical protein